MVKKTELHAVTSENNNDVAPIAKPGKFSLDKFKTKSAAAIANVESLQTGLSHHNIAQAKGYRAITVVPMMRGDSAIGAISVVRRQPGALSDRRRELLRSIANQAVIAIENTRLFNELRESLQEQTATSEVLQVISSSPGDVQPVFDTMLEKAVRICDAKFGNIYRWDGDALRLVATYNTPPDYAKHRRHSPFRADQDNAVARMIASKKVVHVVDAAAYEAYTERRDPTVVAAVELGGIRSFAATGR